jgi:lipoprotein-anchoring transpeptidase ErfK/SrfK
MSTDSSDAPVRLSRRAFVIGLPFALAGCTTTGGGFRMLSVPMSEETFDYAEIYGPRVDQGRKLKPVPWKKVDRQFLRQRVAYAGSEPAGSIVVDPANRHLYHVEERGRAMRYGVGVGREGFLWAGEARVRRKAAWPTWTPPAEMQARDPKARKWAGGMPGGVENPLGARALYLYQGNRDTLYRLHGTNDPLSIGQAMSSGCIRLWNHDIIDLHVRVTANTPVIVLG